MKRRSLAFLLSASTWILVIHDATCSQTKLQCLCTKCPKAVCTSHYGCYIDVKQQRQNRTHGRARQKITYGCIEEYNVTMCKKHEKKGTKKAHYLPICCSDEDLCNMPLLLKDVIARKHKKEQAQWKRRLQDNNKQSCPEVEPAIQLASVILPSILIAIVFLISFLLFAELIRHRKFYACEKPPQPESHVSPKRECKYLNRDLSCDLTSSYSDTPYLTLSSLLKNVKY